MTTPLFMVDQAENDRLILDAAQRRQDLVTGALQSFAPHLLGSLDVKVVHLWSASDPIRKWVRESLGGSPKVIVVEHTSDVRGRKGVNEVLDGIGSRLNLPESADFVLTRSALNARVEWLAAGLKALPAVVPESENYLRQALDKKGLLVIVGGDQR